MFSGAMKVLRDGPAPLTLVSLGRWASIAAAAGDLSRGCRVFHPGSCQAASRRTTSLAPFRYTVRHTSSFFGSRTEFGDSHTQKFACGTDNGGTMW
jgi:hypothetical protein